MDLRGFRRVSSVLLLASIGLSGCSEEEPLKLDPGVSPFYPGDSASESGSTKTDTAGGEPKGRPSGGSRAKNDSAVPTGPIRPDEVEKQIRVAIHTAQKGDSLKADQLLDQVLVLQPLNREALVGRGIIALEQFTRASSLADQDAAASRAAEAARTIQRVYESPKKTEVELYARALSAEAKVRVLQGKNDQALAVLNEAVKAGLDPFPWAEQDKAMAPLRSSPRYEAAVKAFEESRIAQARERLKGKLDKPLDFPFDFKLPNLEGKPVSLADFKGKVVLLDLWGTWCGPCRESIPRLVEFSRKFDRNGLAVVGLTYEKTDPTDPETGENVKKFVKQAGIPYPCLIGDEATLKLVPNFKGFPTSMVLDRAGKVRLLITENTAGTLDSIEDAIVALLAEPASAAAKSK